MLTRRQWLTGTLAVLAARFEVACGSDPAAAGKSGTPAGDDFERWQALLDALRKSPDHLRAAADAAVLGKDPKVIFEFVRDNIATVPPLGQAESIETAVRFGVDNLLRCGAGTPRERAELLVALLDRAGLSATVVRGDGDGPLATSDAPGIVYLRNIDLAFAPGPPASGTWEASAPSGAADPVFIDAGALESAALFAKLRPLVPTSAAVTAPFLGTFNGVPLVALESGGSTVYLNTLLPDAEYGTSYATGIAPAAAPDSPRSVLVRVSATRARAADAPITLVEGTFGYDELAGSRMRISPQPVLTLPAFLASKPFEVNNFIAGLALLGADGIAKRFVRGVALSAAGDVVEAGSGGTTVSGVPLVTGGDPNSVSAVSAAAAAPRAPIVDLVVAPTDGAGKVVPGLAAQHFTVEEDGVQVSAVVRENGGGPRVLLLWDSSGSQPTLTDPMAQGIADGIFTAVPNAAVQVTAVDGVPSASGFTLASAGAVKQALLTNAGGNTSPIYAGLLLAFQAAPTLIVIFTDGDAEKSPGLAAQCLAASGTCPVIAVGCHGASATTLPDVLTLLAAQSGGAFVDGADLADLTQVQATIDQVGSGMSSRPYRLAYVSAGAAGTHTVHVKVGNADATTTYTLSQPASGAYSEFVGVHLHVEMDGVAVDRTLVGLPPLPLPADVDATDQLRAASLAVRDFFLSSTWITFEGGAPTLSAWIDDALSAAVGWKPVQQAIDAKSAKQAYAACETVPMRPIVRALLAHSPLPQPSGAIVSEYALRAAVHMTLPLSRRTSLDLLPTTRFMTLGTDDGATAFDQAMRASLRLAVAEAATAKGSTLSYLSSAPLQSIPLGTVSAADLVGFPVSERAAMAEVLSRYPDTYRIIAGDGSSTAFWAIDASSGTALGILENGTGGAVESCLELVDFANNQIDALGLLVSEIDAGLASTFTVIAAIGKAAAVAVAEAALSFTDPLLDPSLWQLGETIICSIGSDLLGNQFPEGKSGSTVANLAYGYLKNSASGSILGLLPECKPAGLCSNTAP